MQLASPDAQFSLVLFARLCVKWVQSFASRRVRAMAAVAVEAVVEAVAVAVAVAGNVVARGTGLSAVALVSKSQESPLFCDGDCVPRTAQCP